MSSNHTDHRNLQATGLLTLAVFVIVGFGLTLLPGLFTPKQVAYICRIPLGTGVGGLEKGSSVLVGGLPRGKVTLIETVQDGDTPNYFDIGFTLDQQVPLGPDGEIQKYVGISGGSTLLNVIDLGSPDQAWPDGRRILPLSMKSSGTAALLGIPISKSIENTSASASQLGTTLPLALKNTGEKAREIPPQFSAIRTRVEQDIQVWKQDTSNLEGRGQVLVDRFDKIRSAYDQLRSVATPILDFMDWVRGPIAERIEVIRQRMQGIQNAIESVEAKVEPLRSSYEQTVKDGRNAVASGQRSIERLQEIAPEIKDASGRIFARSSLAGGQLKRLLDSALTTGIKAILIRPDHESLSRQQFIESIENALLAAYSLQASARTLDGFMERNEEMIRAHPELASILAKPMEQRITRMNERLQQLYEFVIRNMP